MSKTMVGDKRKIDDVDTNTNNTSFDLNNAKSVKFTISSEEVCHRKLNDDNKDTQNKFKDIDKISCEGIVTITYTNDSAYAMYTGHFVNNMIHGHGVLSYKNKMIYEGQFKKGLYHGKGKITYPNGNIYGGVFCEGKKHGNGSLVCANGEILSGLYINDQKKGSHVLVDKNKKLIFKMFFNDKEVQ
jgi:hypothetical protein